MSTGFPSILGKLVSGSDLDRPEASQAMGLIMDGEATDAQIGAFLAALRLKGETSSELLGFVDVMRERAVPVRLCDPDAVDLCGTGGDGLGTINVSTIASFVVAGAGVTVAKHGNRSVSSRSGSADVLRELGVNIDLPPARTEACINEIGIGFLFAPVYHPAMKSAAGPRSQLGIKTCFNLLGPLCNPAGVRRQVVGTFDARSSEVITRIFIEMNPAAALVVNSDDGLDEVSPGAETRVSEIRAGRPPRSYVLTPESFGLKIRHPLASVLGGTPTENAAIALSVLQGRRGPLRDFILINSALGLRVSGHEPGAPEAFALCSESLDSGRAYGKLRSLVEYTNR
ncbi:MAG TPA: anthranilate phosphoribosyltransferase [Bacteroidota bacterium]|nr:anthranilate phosphoribosyltransferase [Bacteroidota bacterium]